MTILHFLLAQEVPMPEWAKGSIVGMVLCFLGGLIPYIITLIKTWRQERRLDEELSTSDSRQLLKDLRTERQELRVEIKAIRTEHLDCLQRAAAQESEIRWLKQEVENLQEEMTVVHSEMSEVQTAVQTDQSRTHDNPKHK